MTILVSACLLGERCRYDGKSKPMDESTIMRLNEKYTVIPVCPEMLGGLTVPRLPCEICGERVMREDGTDCTDEYNNGAKAALALAKEKDAAFCLLKSKSPSCGKDFVYDGSFTRTLRNGNGIAAELLINNGYSVFDENELGELLK